MVDNERLDARVRQLLEVASGPNDSIDELASLHRLQAQIAASPSSKHRGRRSQWVVIAAGAGIAFASTAAAATGVVDGWFGGDESAPANRVEALREPQEPVEPPSTGEVSMQALLGPPANLGGDFAFLRKQMPMVETLNSPDPKGVGELLPIEDNLRLLLHTKAHGITVEIIAVPTTRGKVCYWLWTLPSESFTGSCIDGFDAEAPITAGLFTQQDSTSSLSGIAADEVTSITVQLPGGSSEPATLGRNAYAWIAPKPNLRPEGILVTLSDGSVRQVDAAGRPRGE